MGDALTNSVHLECESKAEDAYTEKLLNYLYNDTFQNKEAALEKMLEYASIFRGGDILKELKFEFKKLEENDYEIWKRLSNIAERTIFKVRPDLKRIFLEAAQKRGIGSLQWVV